jgi:hypothetical protein
MTSFLMTVEGHRPTSQGRCEVGEGGPYTFLRNEPTVWLSKMDTHMVCLQ